MRHTKICSERLRRILALSLVLVMALPLAACGENRKSQREVFAMDTVMKLTAYGKLHKKSRWIGVFASVVPFMILPYYCIIGGWVLKYFIAFLTGNGAETAADGYFTGFITGYWQPILFDVLFLASTSFVIYRGVNKGIESISKVLMPVLLVFVVAIAVFSVTIKGSEGRTGLDGLKVYIIPSIEGKSAHDLFIVVLDA